jgi:hypothetical protein
MESCKGAHGSDNARISVRDHGIGIPKEDISHLFTRFFRAKNADSGQYPGTGLGLAIVQQVLSHHNGSIHVESEVGEGTTFTVEIPLYLSPEDQLILERRPSVLERAINSLQSATPENIKAVTHEIGGAIGFYGFSYQAEEILAYSREQSEKNVPLDQYAVDKSRLISLLQEELTKITGGKDE